MDKHHGAGAIVVGIDGSKAAVTAAEWALDEAMSRTSPLRLVYVISADDDDYPPETDYAEEVAGPRELVRGERHVVLRRRDVSRPDPDVSAPVR